MLAGEPYFAPDPELAGMQLHARTLLHAFNSSPPPAGGQRREIVRVGAGSTVGAGSVVTRDIPPRVLAAGNPCRVIRAPWRTAASFRAAKRRGLPNPDPNTRAGAGNLARRAPLLTGSQYPSGPFPPNELRGRASCARR